jgi:hypothetical protein
MQARDQDAAPLRLSTWPTMAAAPAVCRIQYSIEPDPANRQIVITADSPGFYRSSVVALDGDKAARTGLIEYRDLPPGVYDVIAALIGSNGRERAVIHRTVTVVGSDS